MTSSGAPKKITELPAITTFDVNADVVPIVDASETALADRNKKATVKQLLDQASFTQAGTGAVTRTLESKLRDVVSVKDFGAVGDGVADDTAAIQAALSSSRVSLYIPSGRYRITSNLNRSGHTHLFGDGLGASVFVFNGTSGLIYSGGSGADHYDMKHFVLERLAFESIGVNSGALLDAGWTDGIGGTSKSIVIRDCEFTGTDASGGFAHGIRLTNARNVRIDNVRVAGDMDALPIASGNGLTLVGSNPNGAPVEIFIDAFQVYFCTNGIDVSGWVEGIYLNKSTFIACRRGLNVNIFPADKPLLIASGNHFATDLNGILCVGFVQTRISSNSFYCVNTSGSTAAYTGIVLQALDATGDNLIAANDFRALYDPGDTYGIIIANDASHLENTIITDNTFTNFDIGVQLSPGTAGVKVTDSNIFYNCGVNNASSNGSNIVEIGSYAVGAVGGSTRTFGDGLIVKFGSSVLSTDSSGNGTITFGTAFPANIYTAFVNNGDQVSQGAAVFCVNALNTSTISFSLRPNPGVQTVRVNWVAFGQ